MSPTGPLRIPLSDPMAELVAARFRVLAEPMRIKRWDRQVSDTDAVFPGGTR